MVDFPHPAQASSHARSYRTYAWGSDELRPVTREPFEWMEMGLTLLSSLDTMLLMGLEDRYHRLGRW